MNYNQTNRSQLRTTRCGTGLEEKWNRMKKAAPIQCAAIKKTPVQYTNIIIFGIVQYFFTKFSEIILDTICHYCRKFYRLIFRCLEVA